METPSFLSKGEIIVGVMFHEARISQAESSIQNLALVQIADCMFLVYCNDEIELLSGKYQKYSFFLCVTRVFQNLHMDKNICLAVLLIM